MLKWWFNFIYTKHLTLKTIVHTSLHYRNKQIFCWNCLRYKKHFTLKLIHTYVIVQNSYENIFCWNIFLNFHLQAPSCPGGFRVLLVVTLCVVIAKGQLFTNHRGRKIFIYFIYSIKMTYLCIFLELSFQKLSHC